jgi:hypothetical protein
VIASLALALAVASQSGALSRSDAAAAYRAAGFRWENEAWRSDCADLGNPSYTPGRIDAVRDLNRDGRPEAVIVEDSAACFGNTGRRFAIVSKQGNGRWRLITQRRGFARFLAAHGSNGWPDIELGLPGLCTPVLRWNGRAYALNRFSRADAPHCRLPEAR